MSDRLFDGRYTRIILLLLLVALAALIAGLFVHVTRDASKYALIAREILETGDFINLKVHGEPYNQKPPLLFWLSTVSFSLFGISDFAFKLPVLLLSFWGLYATFRLGESLFNRNTGILAALFLGSSQIFFLYHMDIHTDTVLQTFVTLSLWQFAVFLKTNRTRHLTGGFLAIGLAMLTKGPIGAVVPAFAVTGTLLFTRQYKRLTDPRWYAGILLVVIMIIPALMGLYKQFGSEGILFYFWGNNIGRISGTLVSKDFNYLFYFLNLFVLFFPWMILLFIAVWHEFRDLAQRRFMGNDWFVFSGIWFVFGILTVSHGKLPNYIYFLMPLFSILTARFVHSALSGEREILLRTLLKIQHSVAALGAILVVALVGWLFPVQDLWEFFLLGFLGFIAIFPFTGKGNVAAKLLVPSLAMVITLNFFINHRAAPAIFSDQASVKAAFLFNREAAPGEALCNYNYPSHELFFYARQPVRQLRNDLTMWELLRNGKTWVFTTGEVVERLPTHELPPLEIIPLEHVWINKLQYRYLNPASRPASRDTLYLIKPSSPGNTLSP